MDLNAFLSRMRPYVKKAVYSHIGTAFYCSDEIDDCCQDILIKFTNGIKNLDGTLTENEYKSYLSRIITNYCIDYLRNRQRPKYRALKIDISESDHLANDTMTPERKLIVDQKMEALMLAVNRLSDREQMVISERFMGGFKIREIAKNHGININTVKAIIKRGVDKIKKNISDD